MNFYLLFLTLTVCSDIMVTHVKEFSNGWWPLDLILATLVNMIEYRCNKIEHNSVIGCI